MPLPPQQHQLRSLVLKARLQSFSPQTEPDQVDAITCSTCEAIRGTICWTRSSRTSACVHKRTCGGARGEGEHDDRYEPVKLKIAVRLHSNHPKPKSIRTPAKVHEPQKAYEFQQKYYKPAWDGNKCYERFPREFVLRSFGIEGALAYVEVYRAR